MIGNSIDLSSYADVKLTKETIKEINNEISNKFLALYYKLKQKKAERFSFEYASALPKAGDVIRVLSGSCYHYGVYLNAGEVIQFGRAINADGENAVVNAVSLNEFCGTEDIEVRILKKSEKKFARDLDDIEKYAKSCMGQGGYSPAYNNCLVFVNRITLKL